MVEVAGEKSDQLLNGETETTVNDNVKTGTDTKTTPTETTVKKVAPSPQDQEVLRFKAPFQGNSGGVESLRFYL